METAEGPGAARGWEQGGVKGGAQGIFRAGKLLYMTRSRWIHAILHLSKPTDYTAPRTNPNVNHGLWVTLTCPRTPNGVTNIPLWWGAENGEAVCPCVGHPYLGNPCPFHLILL